MTRERTLKVVLIIAGLLFMAGSIPGVMLFSKDPGTTMLMSIYTTLGVFLLLAARNASANRSLISFAGWANVAHAGVMALQVSLHVIRLRELGGVIIFGVIGIALIALAPITQAVNQRAATSAA